MQATEAMKTAAALAVSEGRNPAQDVMDAMIQGWGEEVYGTMTAPVRAEREPTPEYLEAMRMARAAANNASRSSTDVATDAWARAAEVWTGIAREIRKAGI